MNRAGFKKVCTDIKKTSSLFSLIIEQIIEPLIHSLNLEKSEIFIDGNVYSFNLKNNEKAIPITIVFWMKPERISFFLENYEISDDYIKNETEADNVLTFLKQILSFDIIKKLYTNSSGDTKKLIYIYSVIEFDGTKKEVEDTVQSKFSWFQKLKESKTVFKPWI